MKHILIVGKSFSGIKRYLSDNGFDYTVLQDRLATKFPDKKLKNRQIADFSNQETLFQAVDTVNTKKPIDAVFVTYEHYILPASQIANYLGLPGLPETAALACTDKELMREKFATAPEKISPGFKAVGTLEEVLNFASKHSFPLILKPANLSKSLLVTKSNDIEELRVNFQKTIASIDSVYDKYAPGRQPKILIEEFLEGSIHSVDAFVDSNGTPHVLDNIVDYQTGYDIGFDDNFHYSRLLPSSMSKEDQAELRRIAAIGCEALGMRSSPAHIEIIMTADGPRIVEIGARNGGYRERMHALANGIDITKNALALSLNQPLDILPKKNDCCAVLELFPKQPGEFIGIHNEDKLQSLESLNYLSVKAKPNQYIGKAGDGYKMAAVVILHSSDKEQFDHDLDFINQQVYVKTN